jgi:hypothetical protein
MEFYNQFNEINQNNELFNIDVKHIEDLNFDKLLEKGILETNKRELQISHNNLTIFWYFLNCMNKFEVINWFKNPILSNLSNDDNISFIQKKILDLSEYNKNKIHSICVYYINREYELVANSLYNPNIYWNWAKEFEDTILKKIKNRLMEIEIIERKIQSI